MKRKTITLTLLSIMLVLSMGIGSAWAYFTDSSMATGGLVIEEPTTTITEEYGPGTKDITIANTSVFASKDLGADASGANWSGSIDSWYTYDVPLAPSGQEGDHADPLNVTFRLTLPKRPDNPHGAEVGDVYNVTVVYESIPVTYDANGDAVAPTWN